MMLRRVVFDQAAAGDALDGAAGGRPRSPAFFAVPRLLVGLAATKRGTPDCDSTARASLLGSPRSPRSWDSQRVGLGGLVDSLAEPAADAKNRLLGFQMRPTKLQCLAKSYTSPPKDCGHAQPELGEAEATAGAGGMSVPCTRFYGDVKSGPEVIVSGGAQLHLVDRAKFPASGSLPVSIGGPRRYIGSVSAMEVEQSEDYTCIIAHGSNPKTTRIFGDCILEPCPVLMPDWESKEIDVDKEGAELYWLVADEESTPGSCSACNKDLDGNGSYVYRTRELPEQQQEQNNKDPSRTPTSNHEPATSQESGVLGQRTRKSVAANESMCTPDKRTRKTSMVKEPILQQVKRQKSVVQ
ncbi:hypothetical protein D1007_02947 [Hordeum vulgare]|nr:hypothetical protein D1007_02947 [Hordeum vulgare]